MSASDLAELPRELEALVSPRVGIVTALEECLVDVDEPPLVRIACELSAAGELIGVELGSARSVGGSGLTRQVALGAAVGEAVERYSASYVPHERLVEASAAELERAAAAPSSFALFAPWQYDSPGFPYERFTAETRVPWIEGVDIETGERAFLPAELVFLSDVERASGQRVGYATSSGLACGGSYEEALERALLELLERDAFMLCWWRRASPARLDWRASSWMRSVDERYFAATGLEYLALDLSPVHDLPTVLGVVRAKDGSGAALGIGAAARPTVADAWWRALAEAFASRSACRKLELVDPGRRYEPDGSDVLGFEDHIRFYADGARAESASFLWAGSVVRSTDDVRPVELEPGGLKAALLARIRRAGSRAFAVDVTAPDVASAGLSVVRAVTPGLCALDAAHALRFLGSKRLLHTPELDILTAPPTRVEDLNPLPHPFP